MAHRLKNRLIVLQKLSSKERRALSDRLFELSQHIFGNATKDKFERFVTYSGALKTYMMLYENSKGELVGFFALHYHHERFNRKERIIFRGQTGLLQEYRRSKANMYFTLFIILKYRLLHPFLPIHCYLAVLSPSMYGVLSKGLVCCSPRHKATPSIKDTALAEELKEKFGFDPDPKGNKWITPVGWISIASEVEEKYWKETKNPHIRYYIERNPDFRKGNALITLIPFSWKNIFLSSFNVCRYLLKKGVKSFG